MSSSMVRQALALFEDDFKEKDCSSKKKKTDSSQLLSTNKQGFQKQKKKLKEKQSRDEDIMRKRRKAKSAIEEYWHHYPKDKTSTNLYYLQKLSEQKKLPQRSLEKILEHHRGRLSKDRPLSNDTGKESTAFSDRDFDKFEAEYNFS